MSNMKKGNVFCRNMAVSVVLVLIIVIAYQMILGNTSTVTAATGYPDTLVEHMQHLAEQDYVFIDVSNMRLQQDGVGPFWNKAASLYCRNVTRGTDWRTSVTASSEGLSDEEKKMVRELRQSNIFCWKLTDADTDSIEFSYSNDNTVNKDHYYRTAAYKVSDLKGNLHAYLASYTAKEGDNQGKKAYMIGQVALPKAENKETNKENVDEENTEIIAEEKESVDGNTNSEEEEEYEVTETEVMADEDVVTIRVAHDFSGGAWVVFYKGSTYVSKTLLGSDKIFQFDCSSTTYDCFNIEENVGGNSTTATGNKTVTRTSSEIETAVAKYNNGNKLTATVGGWSDANTRRTLTLSEYTSLSDSSLNIPEGTFTKEEGTFYAKATFYDYYSDREIEGTQRKNVTDGADSNAVRVQAGKFNRAIAEYFKGKNTTFSTGQSPLYFGDFNGYTVDSTYYNFVYNNNNGENNKKDSLAAPKQGLVNNKLVGGEVVMGTDNTVVPYFNEDFLRGNNYYSDNIGYVFNNVEFPFRLNDEGYWEFDSYDSSETLRMKKDGDTYFLDRTGTNGAVKGAVVYTATANSNFLPFNDASESGQSPKLNYAYGMKLEIPFYMTADGKVTMGNGAEKDIIFNFLGDDDVWIFIDDDLILDIGGDHGAVKGYINFADCEAVVTGSDSGDYSNTTKASFTKTFDAVTPAERHVLTMYYMERGLWESNMQITFNFPQSNKLEVEKEIVIPTDSEGKSKVNSIFDKAINDVLLKQISFPVSIKNMVTSGESLAVSERDAAIDKTFDEINASTTVAKMKSSSSTEYTNNTTKASRSEVLRYYYPTMKNATAGQSVTDERSILIDYAGSETLDISAERLKNGGYVEFDAYLDYSSEGGPFIALIDSDGDRIGGWTEGIVYDGGTGTMDSYAWTTLKVDIAKMAKASLTNIKTGTTGGTFDYDKVTQIQFAHWAPANVYVDNIHIKAPATYGSGTGFSKDQKSIPDYGSINANALQPIIGAEYILNPVADKNGNTYSYVNDGNIYLKHTDLAVFTDQFRRESYLSINENCDQNVFNTTWQIYEDDVAVDGASGSGTAVEDGRTEATPDNSGVGKPSENTMLFKSYDESLWEDKTHFYNLRVKYTNELKVGSIKIKKNVLDGQGNLVDTELPYKIRVTFTDIAGLELEKVEYGAYTEEQSIYAEHSVVIDGKTYFEITGIPAGTKYSIEELQEDRDDFVLSNIKHEGGNDIDGVYDETNKVYTGTVMEDTETDAEDIITIVNNVNPVTEDGDLGGQKIWSSDAQTADPAPEGVKLKLQRRFIKKIADGETTSSDTGAEYEYADVEDKDGKVIEFEVKNYSSDNASEITCEDGNKITIKTGANYKYSINGLPLYGLNTNKRQRKYEYRFVETAIIKSDGTELAVSTSNDTTGNETKSDTSSIDETTGYIVTGGIGVENSAGNTTYDVTNTYDPKTNLQIIKVSGNDTSNLMEGVTFRLEKLVKNDDGDLVEDTTFNGGNDRDATTNEQGEITFTNLQDGFYRLTEIKTISGHSLLASPINISISRLNGSIANVNNEQYTLEITGNTISLTISNQGLLELPMTGSNGRKIVIMFGICLALGGEGLYLWNLYSYRKRRHSYRRK